MTKASIDLQELRRRIYLKAKAEPAWRFWGLFVHVCKLETLHEASKATKRNNGAPGNDGVTFESAQKSRGFWATWGFRKFPHDVKTHQLGQTPRNVRVPPKSP